MHWISGDGERGRGEGAGLGSRNNASLSRGVMKLYPLLWGGVGNVGKDFSCNFADPPPCTNK